MTTFSEDNRYGSSVSEKRLNRIREVINNKQLDLTLIIENIHDPHNVSAIFRSADTVGIDEVQLLYTREKFPGLHPKVTVGSAKWIKQNRYSDPKVLATEMKARGFNTYTTHLSKDAVSIHDIDWTKPSAIILGNENRGVSTEMTDLADQNIIIPMFGMVESLNVSVATAVILFEACRQRIAAGMYPNPHLETEWLEHKTDDWVKINFQNRLG
ncbi:MAG: RNA methyltransferase [Candidatus Marinimicrobia bacterium]|nr:RNA methyltransferase [Candidatus Neomarinimicrobiota bacterium]